MASSQPHLGRVWQPLPLTTARYKAELHEIRERHGEAFDIIGEPMVITEPAQGGFNPARSGRAATQAAASRR